MKINKYILQIDCKPLYIPIPLKLVVDIGNIAQIYLIYLQNNVDLSLKLYQTDKLVCVQVL